MALIVDEGKFVLRDSSNTQTYENELATAGKYVDKNIKIEVDAKKGEIYADVSSEAGSAAMEAVGFDALSDKESEYYVLLSTEPGSAIGRANVLTEGWVNVSDNKTSSQKSVPINGDGSKAYIPKNTITGSVTDLVAPSVTINGDASGFTPSNAATEYFVTVSGACNNGSVRGKATAGEKTGMVGSKETDISAVTEIVPNVAGSGSKVYIPENDVVCSIVDVVNPSISIKDSAIGFTKADYVTDYCVTASYNETEGSVKSRVESGPNAGIVRGNLSKTSEPVKITTNVDGGGFIVYIPENTISASVVDLVNPSVTISGEASGFTPSENTTNYYVTISGTAKNGSVKSRATAGATTGIVKSGKTSVSGAEIITTEISGDDSKVYIPTGDYSTSVGTHSITKNPIVSPSVDGTVASISTTVKPSGTNGTDYWTMTPSGVVSANGVSSATGKAKIDVSGYIPCDKNGKESAVDTVSIVPTISSGTTRYIKKATKSITNGVATIVDGTASAVITGMETSETDTGYVVEASATGGSVSISESTATVGVGYNPTEVTVGTAAINKSGSTVTEKKYIQKGVLGASVDGDITFTPSVSTDMATISKPASGTKGVDYYSITASGSKSGSVVGKANVAKEGYVKSETASGGSAVGNIASDDVKYIRKGVLHASATATASATISPGAVTIGNGAADISGKTKLSIAPVTSTNSVSKYYIPLLATTAANTTGTSFDITGTATASVSEAGFVPSNTTGTGSVTGKATAKTSARNSNNYYIPLPETSYSNVVPNNMTDSDFTDISASVPESTSDGYVYITQGYNPNQKIRLSRLIHDGASLISGSSDYIVSGQTAYDNGGNLIVGTLEANSQSGSLVADSSKASGYSVYRVTTTKGHNRDSVRTTDVPVYQGEWS